MKGDCSSSKLSPWTRASGTDCNDSALDCRSVNLPMCEEFMMSCFLADLMPRRISFVNDELNGF